MRSTLWSTGRAAARVIGALVLVALAAGPAATDTFWRAESEYWRKPENWTAGKPTAATDTYVNNGGYAIVDQPGEACDWLWIAENAGQTGTVWMTAGDLSATLIHVGAGGDGTFIQTDGQLSVSNDIYLGFNTTGVGKYRMWAGQLSAQRVVLGGGAGAGTGEFKYFGGTLGRTGVQVGANGLFLGEADWQHEGKLEVTGGAVDLQTHTLRLGGLSYTAGYETLCGLYSGTLSAANESIGYDEWPHVDSVVRFYQTGGVHTVDDDFGIGCGGYGYYELSGGDLNATWERIGYDNGMGLPGEGDFLQRGGTHTVTQYLTVGKYGRGTYELTGGVLSAKNESIGSSSIGTGEFLQTGGTHTVTIHLYIGEQGVGTYTLRGGTLDVGDDIRGGTGTGTFIYDGGALTVGTGIHVQTFILGKEAGRSAEFTLAPGQSMSGESVVVGEAGTGLLRLDGGTYEPGTTTVGPGGTLIGNVDLTYPGALEIAGGTADFSGQVLVLNSSGGPVPTSRLSAGSLSAGEEFVGQWARAHTFVQTGGTHTVEGTLDVRDGGRYELRAGTGQLSTGGTRVGWIGGTGLFIQIGGTHTVAGALDVGEGGRYELRSGTGTLVVTGHEYVGYYGAGTFWQQGGTHTITGNLNLGFSGSPGTIGNGTYEMLGGQLATPYVNVGTTFGTGTFTQSGGTNNTAEGVYIGVNQAGTYTISAGTLNTETLWLGPLGTLNITGAGANINVSQDIEMHSGSTFTAVPGSTIHMTGSAFRNYTTVPAAMPGLRNLKLVFEGGPVPTDTLEVACRDKGRSWSGWTDNFALGGLQLGGADVGQVRLLDGYDNQPGWTGTECLYVENLTLGAGSALDLDGLKLYYLTADIDPGATVTGGSLTKVLALMPEIDIQVLPGGLTGYVISLQAFGKLYAAKTLALGFSGKMSQVTAPGGVLTPSLTGVGLLEPAQRTVDSHFLLFDDDMVVVQMRETATELIGQFDILEKAVSSNLLLARIVVGKGEEVRLVGQVVTVDGQTIPIDLVVPEPATLALLALGGVALLGRRRRHVVPVAPKKAPGGRPGASHVCRARRGAARVTSLHATSPRS